MSAGSWLQLGLEARLAARVKRSPEEFHAAAEAAERLWGRADWQPESRCSNTSHREAQSRQHTAVQRCGSRRKAAATSCTAVMTMDLQACIPDVQLACIYQEQSIMDEHRRGELHPVAACAAGGSTCGQARTGWCELMPSLAGHTSK